MVDQKPQVRERLHSLADVIAGAIEAEMEAGAVNAKEVLNVLCGVIGWVIRNTSPEWHAELEAYLMDTIPKMVEQGRKEQAQILKDKSQ